MHSAKHSRSPYNEDAGDFYFDEDFDNMDYDDAYFYGTRFDTDFDVDYNDDYDTDFGGDYVDNYDTDFGGDYVDDYDTDFYEDEYYDNPGTKRSSSSSGQRRRSRPARLAAPLQKGNKLLFRISKSLMRNLSVFLILAIIALMIYNFFVGSAPYGDIENAVSTRTVSLMLAAYITVAASLLLFELFSLLWAMSKVRVRDAYGFYREDVGRGQFSFIFLYLLSYASFLLNRYIPEFHEALTGIKGALDVFGSLHNILFGLCLAGVISCLIRKYSRIL